MYPVNALFTKMVPESISVGQNHRGNLFLVAKRFPKAPYCDGDAKSRLRVCPASAGKTQETH